MIAKSIKKALRIVTPKFYYPIDRYFLLRTPLIWSSKIINVAFFCTLLGSALIALALLSPLSIDKTLTLLQVFLRVAPIILSAIGFALWCYFQSQYDVRRSFGFSSRFFEIKSALLYLTVPILFAGAAFAPHYMLSKRISETTESFPRVQSIKAMIGDPDQHLTRKNFLRIPKENTKSYKYFGADPELATKLLDRVYQYNDYSLKKERLQKKGRVKDEYSGVSFPVYRFEKQDIYQYRNRYFDKSGLVNAMRFEAWLEDYLSDISIENGSIPEAIFELEPAEMQRFFVSMLVISESIKSYRNTKERNEIVYIWIIAMLITSFFLSSGTGAINMFGRKALGVTFLKSLFMFWAIAAIIAVIEIILDTDGDFMLWSFILLSLLVQAMLYIKKNSLVVWLVTSFTTPVAITIALAYLFKETDLDPSVGGILILFMLGYFLYLPLHKGTLYKIYSAPQ
ncbi:MAG: hypothetical protein K6L80_12905 [Agarilytica sp.]